MTTSARWLSAAELAAGYRSGATTPEAVASELLDTIDEVDPRINAYCLIDRDTTMAAARAAGQRYLAGAPLGPLDGVPVSIKDLLLTKGWPTLRGSLSVSPEHGAWDVDSPAVARLRAAGAVPLGKVTTPEFGWKGVTDGPRHGITRNPWDPTRTSGGSSGGSAAALAAGLGPLSVGTDGGGSIRIPAAFCGIVGFKATLGRVPMYPPSPFAPVAHVGPMTRTVEDCALLLDVLSGYDSRDWSALPTRTDSAAALASDRTNLSDLRIAYSPDLGFGANDADVQANTDSAVQVLKALGARVETVDLGWSDPAWAYHAIWFAGAEVIVGALAPEARAKVDAGLREALERHRNFSADDYLAAVALRMQLGTQMGQFHDDYDVLVTPAMPSVAFGAGRDVPAGSASPDWTSWTPYSYPFNLTGQPAISVPSGFAATADGGGRLPTGVQFVAARHRDDTVLRVAAAYEAAVDFTTMEQEL